MNHPKKLIEEAAIQEFFEQLFSLQEAAERLAPAIRKNYPGASITLMAFSAFVKGLCSLQS